METHDTTAILVEENGKILFIVNRNRKEGLEIPAGHVDPGETPLETARREAIEEVGGVEIEEEKPFVVFMHPAGDHMKKGKYLPPHLHRCHTFQGRVTGEIKPGSDAEKVLWMAEKEAEKIGVAGWVETILKAARE